VRRPLWSESSSAGFCGSTETGLLPAFSKVNAAARNHEAFAFDLTIVFWFIALIMDIHWSEMPTGQHNDLRFWVLPCNTILFSKQGLLNAAPS
jgi:hypothetical protein